MRWDAEKYDAVEAPQMDAGRDLVAMANVNEADAILDVGCGTGKLTVDLARLASRGSVTGIDPSREMLQKAQKTADGIGNICFSCLSVEEMELQDQFDLAFSNSALQWVKDQRRAVASIHRSLKSGGRIAFQLPARNFCREFFEYAGEAISLLGFGKFYENWQTPWYLPNREEYASVLKDAGFGQIDVVQRCYRIVFDSVNGVLDWWTSAGLRPYLEMLPRKEQEYFKYAFAMSYERNRTAEGIGFDFRRLFAFAAKGG